jgi:hypothetical protein
MVWELEAGMWDEAEVEEEADACAEGVREVEGLLKWRPWGEGSVVRPRMLGMGGGE